MSFDALAWAARQNTGSAGTKLVLLGLAECAHRETAEAYPSIAALVEFSSMDRKSVIANLSRLEAAGFVADTGKREGKTKQVKVYRLSLQSVPKAEQSQKRNSTVNSAKQSQKRDTDTVREPVSEKAKASSQRTKGIFVLPADIPAEPFEGFVAMRKALRKPMNDHAKHLAVLKLRKLRDEDGWPPGEVLNHSTLNSYQGLFPPKDRRNDRPHQPASRNTAAVEYSLRGLDPHATF